MNSTFRFFARSPKPSLRAALEPPLPAESEELLQAVRTPSDRVATAASTKMRRDVWKGMDTLSEPFFGVRGLRLVDQRTSEVVPNSESPDVTAVTGHMELARASPCQGFVLTFCR